MDEYPIIVLNYDDVLWKQKSSLDILRFAIWSITFINKFRPPMEPLLNCKFTKFYPKKNFNLKKSLLL